MGLNLLHGCHQQTADKLDPSNNGMWSAAITDIEYRDGKWWAHNDEYATAIRHCPWCGVFLQPQPDDA